MTLRALEVTALSLVLTGSVTAASEALKAGVFDPPRWAPDFSLQGSNGQELKISHYRGKVVSIPGRLRRVRRFDPNSTLHLAGVKDVYECWLYNDQFGAGNPAIHLFDLGFLRRVTRGATRLPFHIARKKVAHINEMGRPVTPTKENALKFERFVFDVLPLAERWTVVETSRWEEFAPLKNADGADSPAAVRAAITALAALWLERAGAELRHAPNDRSETALEVRPLFVVDAEGVLRYKDMKLIGATFERADKLAGILAGI